MDILGREPKKQARPWTDCRSGRGAACDYKSNGWQPRSLGRSVSTSWCRPQGRLSASRCDGASATLAPVTTTSTAARTRERGRSRVERVTSLCPPRALEGRHPRSFTANPGQRKSLLNGSVLAKTCSSQAHDSKTNIPVDLIRGSLSTGFGRQWCHTSCAVPHRIDPRNARPLQSCTIRLVVVNVGTVSTVVWWSVRGHRELRCGFGVAVTVGWGGCRQLVHHTRSTRSGRSRPSGRSMRPWTRANATLSVASWAAAASKWGR
jgi:hypothetical protein